jgi:hypothetical protein
MIIRFDAIVNAFLGMSSPCSDVTETTTSDDEYDQTSISTSSSIDEKYEKSFQKAECPPTVYNNTDHKLFIHMGKSLPIACPSPSKHHVREKEFEEDMMAVYDAATWRMYNRIVDSRKRKDDKKQREQFYIEGQKGKNRQHHVSSREIKQHYSHRHYPNVPEVVYASSSAYNQSSTKEIRIFSMDD